MTGQPAATAARDIQARAFAAGPSIVLGAGAPAPDTPAGERLLAHEVSHIVLGHGGVRRNPDAISGPVSEPRVGTFVLDPALAFTANGPIQLIEQLGKTVAERLLALKVPATSPAIFRFF